MVGDADLNEEEDAAAKENSRYMPLANPNIWRQSMNYLGLCPTLGKGPIAYKLTLEEKFAPYFSEAIQKKWGKWPGNLLKIDSVTASVNDIK